MKINRLTIRRGKTEVSSLHKKTAGNECPLIAEKCSHDTLLKGLLQCMRNGKMQKMRIKKKKRASASAQVLRQHKIQQNIECSCAHIHRNNHGNAFTHSLTRARAYTFSRGEATWL